MRYILDSDHITLYRDGNIPIRNRVALLPDSDLAVTIVSFEEQVRGWLTQIHQAHQTQHYRRLIWAYTRLYETLIYYAEQRVLLYDEAAAMQFRQLQQQRIRVGTQDLRIAAIALANGYAIVTRNRRDFERVLGLLVEDWSMPSASA